MAETAKLDLAAARAGVAVEQPRGPVPWGRIAVYLVLVLGAALAVAPFLWMVSASLMTALEVNLGHLLPVQPLFENYQIAWNRANFALYMWNSVRITVITLVGTLAVCIPAAYAFARMRFFGRNVLFAIMLTTLMIPEIVTLIPNYLTVVWLGRLSQTICGPACSWTDNWPALTIPFLASAFSIFLLRQFFMQIPDDLWDAAQIDGAGHFLFLRKIVMPLSRAPIMTVITFSFIGAWNALLWPLLVVQTDDWKPVAVGLSNFVGQDAPNETHLQMAASVMMIIPILILYFFTQRQFTEGIAASGLKG